MNKETFSKALDKTDEKYIGELTKHLDTHLPRKSFSPFVKYASIAAGSFLVLSTAAIAVVIGTGTPGTSVVYSESLNNTSVQPPETETTSSTLPESSAPASSEQSSVEISQPETYSELFVKDSYFKRKVHDMLWNIDNVSMNMGDYYFEPLTKYFYSITEEYPDIEYLYPYWQRIDNAYHLIDEYALQNSFVTAEESEKYLSGLSENEDSTNIDSYYDPWSYAHTFGLKYEDFKDILNEMGDFNEDEIKLIFEGTREQFIDTFLTRYALYIDGKIYTPKGYLEDKDLDDLVDEGLLPEQLEVKRDAALEDYPDSPWAKRADEMITIYSKIFEAAYDDYKGIKDYSFEEFARENLTSCLKPISDTPVFDETIEIVHLTDEQKNIVTKVYDEYVKMAYLFFNSSFEYKDAPQVFQGTEYEFEKVFFDMDELPEEFQELWDFDWNPQNFIKYTGSTVNTQEKLKEARSKYFTDNFVQKYIDTMFDQPLEDVYLYTWEADGGVYRFCFDGGNKPFLNMCDLYVEGFTQTDDRIEIKIAVDGSQVYESTTNHYQYQHVTIALAVNADGSFQIDDMDRGIYNIDDEPTVRVKADNAGNKTFTVYQPGEFMSYGMSVDDFYEGGTLHFD